MFLFQTIRLFRTRGTDLSNAASRFVATPIPSLNGKIEGQVKVLDDELEKLRKRLIYLETTQKNSRDHLEQVFKHGAGRG